MGEGEGEAKASHVRGGDERESERGRKRTGGEAVGG